MLVADRSALARSATIGDRILETRGYTSGFDYLRLVLALSVLAWHTVPLCFGGTVAGQIMLGPAGYVVRLILPMFFALSGFLVAASLERSATLGVFLGLRALRILPALAVEVTLSALVLGPALTTLPLADYVADRTFHIYFLNVLGWIHYELPGVFAGNPYPNIVNGSLWTVPFELECYLALAALALTSMTFRRPRLFLAVFAMACIVVFAWNRERGITTIAEAVPGKVLVLCFLAGVGLFIWKARIPYNLATFGAAVAAVILLTTSDTLLYLAPFPVAYATAFIGLHQPRRLPVVLSGDYSYGIYLYAFPIQQTVAQVVTQTWYWHLLSALTLTCLFAAFSWHAIEKPTLRLKRLIKGSRG